MPVITASAPGRCGIVGNPTDLYGGSVLSCTVAQRAQARLAYPQTGITLSNDGEIATLNTPADFALRGDKLDIARAALTFFDISPASQGFALELETNILMRAGMAGSTAMLVAIVGALNAYLNLRFHPYALAETARKVEAQVLNVFCGFQDQHMAVFGGLNFMDFAGKEGLLQSQEEPLATIEPLAERVPMLPPLLLAHTGIPHHSGKVHSTPRQRWEAGEPLVRNSYVRVGDLAKRGKRALMKSDWEMLGALMNENHALVSEIGGSGEANDRLIEVARKAGAWGAKLAGAGGGGTIIALTDAPEKVGEALMAAGAERLLTPLPQPGLQLTFEE